MMDKSWLWLAGGLAALWFLVNRTTSGSSTSVTTGPQFQFRSPEPLNLLYLHPASTGSDRQAAVIAAFQTYEQRLPTQGEIDYLVRIRSDIKTENIAAWVYATYTDLSAAYAYALSHPGYAAPPAPGADGLPSPQLAPGTVASDYHFGIVSGVTPDGAPYAA